MIQKNIKKSLLLLIVLALVVCSVGGTIAFIIANSETTTNTFTPAYVTCEVTKANDGTYSVTNTGNVDAYLRVAVVANMMKGADVYWKKPGISVNTVSWDDGSDSFYYYPQKVAPQESVTFGTVEQSGTLKDVPSDYTFTVQVLGEAIQAYGKTDSGTPAVTDAWGVTVDANGRIDN